MERGSPWSPGDAASILSWWSEAGVDTLVAEEPRDWLRTTPAPEPAAAAVAEAPLAFAEPEEELPGQLGLFEAWLASTDRLAFAAPSAPRICPSGDPASGLMILADMPTGEDCAAGVLMTGDAGRLFDRMLAAIGRDRNSIYLAALSCLRSPDGQLSGEPARRCADLARHQIGLVAPRALLLLGDACSRAMLGPGVAQARGRWHEVATHAGPIKALVTMKPDFLLSQPAHKARAWADLQMLIEEVRP
jgi:DNA polymerase